MPYEQHRSCQLPADENAPIWRYMDLAKFESMLDHRALWFCQAARFMDRFEGSYPERNVRDRLLFFGRRAPSGARLNAFAMNKRWEREHKAERSRVYVNCWTCNEGESTAMWGLYCQPGSGIAIRSTFARLRDSMASTPEPIAIGMVSYLDYTRDHMPENNEIDPFLRKRRSYDHERELRALYCHPTLPEETTALPPGLPVLCDLDTLIDYIVVSPGAPSGFRERVTSITNQYDIDKPIKPSSLDDNPVY